MWFYIDIIMDVACQAKISYLFPKSFLAFSYVGRMVPKAGAEASNVLKSILINIATQGAKDAIWGNQAPQPPQV